MPSFYKQTNAKQNATTGAGNKTNAPSESQIRQPVTAQIPPPSPSPSQARPPSPSPQPRQHSRRYNIRANKIMQNHTAAVANDLSDSVSLKPSPSPSALNLPAKIPFRPKQRPRLKTKDYRKVSQRTQLKQNLPKIGNYKLSAYRRPDGAQNHLKVIYRKHSKRVKTPVPTPQPVDNVSMAPSSKSSATDASSVITRASNVMVQRASRKRAHKQKQTPSNLPNARHLLMKPQTKKAKEMKEMEKTVIATAAHPQPQQQQQVQHNKITSKSFINNAPMANKNVNESLMNTHRLKRDGRKTPEQYRQTAKAASSPSQLSLNSISEYYNIPDSNFTSADDVFTYRGYKKLGKIDEGAFGIVSKAIRWSDRALVAVKEVDLRRKRAKRIEEMKRELFVLQKIDNNNVVKLIEHFIIGQTLVIIMEFCAGSNLTTYLKEAAINEQESMHLFKQMATSIKVLHKKGIAHRDVKLNNFLLDSTRKIVKIGDFGLSVVSYRQSYGILMAKTYCGTEPYMAPEILKRNSMGIRSYNPLYADIWSLGVCLYAMLTRTFPFKMHTSQQGLFRAQVTRRWKFPRRLRDILSEEIKDLVWHMLDPEPERRIAINGVVAHPWLNHGQLIVMSYDEADLESLTENK